MGYDWERARLGQWQGGQDELIDGRPITPSGGTVPQEGRAETADNVTIHRTTVMLDIRMPTGRGTCQKSDRGQCQREVVPKSWLLGALDAQRHGPPGSTGRAQPLPEYLSQAKPAGPKVGMDPCLVSWLMLRRSSSAGQLHE